ncbi:MmyB family transcriptional regulator [Micromonospora fluostatini]|uniref:MmyB family transcriptional regulator n=1 Tax=Micromonospora sp. JCM 30529 TaxID=3421643 RepID=UPI003D17C899
MVIGMALLFPEVTGQAVTPPSPATVARHVGDARLDRAMPCGRCLVCHLDTLTWPPTPTPAAELAPASRNRPALGCGSGRRLEVRPCDPVRHPRLGVYTVAGKPPGDKALHHPAIGRIVLTHHSFAVPETSGQHLLVYGSDPGTLALLRSVATSATRFDWRARYRLTAPDSSSVGVHASR